MSLESNRNVSTRRRQVLREKDMPSCTVMPNPSINRTSNGLRPSAAGYVKR